MNARKAGLLVAVAAILAASPHFVSALGRARREAQPIYRDDGSGPAIPFNTSCSGTAWTAVAPSSDTIRRFLTVQVSTSATSGVCITTTTNSGDVCDDNQNGVEITTVTGPSSKFETYDGTAWQCRTRGGTVKIKGYWTRDAGDQGQVNQAR
jgi:hypothetical protein